MATIIPQNELLRRALEYIDERAREHPDVSLASLLDEAGMRFNLSPLDTASLERFIREESTTLKF